MQQTDKDNIPLGIFWMTCTMFLFVSMDAVAKQLALSYPVSQVVWGRFFFHLIVLVAVFGISIRGLLKSNHLPLQCLRSLLIIITTYLFFTGLSKSTLATATTMMFLSPLYVTVLSIPLLGERVGPRRWFGVLAGFTGAMIIVRPGAESFSSANLLLLAAPLTNALYQLLTRKVRTYDNERVTLVYTALIGAVVTTGLVPLNWQTPI